MADFTALKTAIQNAIKQNGNEEITGNLLQDVLLAIVTTLGEGNINNLINSLDAEVTARQQAVSAEAQARQLADSTLQGGINTVSAAITAINNAIGNGCVYAGIATPSSTPASGRVFYLALTAGTYTHFNNLVVPQGINILKNNGSTWSLDSFLGIDDAPTPSSNNLIKSGGAFDFVMTNGSAFDLTAYNNGTTYADLNAALLALNALPAAYKRGGMSFRFVLTSDNNYIQARCIANEFTTDVTQWQTVDAEPTAESDNLVKSGSVWKISKRDINFSKDLCDEIKTGLTNGLISINGAITPHNNYRVSDYIECEGDSIIKFLTFSYTSQTLFCSIVFYNSNKDVLNYGLPLSVDSEITQITQTIAIPQGAAYFRICQYAAFIDTSYCYTYKGNNDYLSIDISKFAKAVYDSTSFRETNAGYLASPLITMHKDDVLFIKANQIENAPYYVISSVDTSTLAFTPKIVSEIGVNEYEYKAESDIVIAVCVYSDANAYVSLNRNYNRNAAVTLDDSSKFTPSSLVKAGLNNIGQKTDFLIGLQDFSTQIKSNLTNGLIKSDGSIDGDTVTYKVSDYIYCKGKSLIRYSTFSYTSSIVYCSIVFFDEDKNALRCGKKLVVAESISQIEQIVSVPESASYFRVSQKADFIDTSYCFVYNNSSIDTTLDYRSYTKGIYDGTQYRISNNDYVVSPIIHLNKGDVIFVTTTSPSNDAYNVISSVDLQTLNISSLVSAKQGTNDYEYEATSNIDIAINVFLDANTSISINRDRNAATEIDDSNKFTPAKVVKEKTDELARAISEISVNGSSYYDMYLNGGINTFDLENVATYIGWVDNPSGKWNPRDTFNHARFRVSPCSTVTITAKSDKPAYYALLKNYPKTNNIEGDVDFAYGQNSYGVVNAGESAEINIPFNCYCVVLCNATPDYANMLPDGFIVENYGLNNLPSDSIICSPEAEVRQLMAHKNTPAFYKGVLYDIFMEDDTQSIEIPSGVNTVVIRLTKRACFDINNYIATNVFQASMKYRGFQTTGRVSPRHPNLVIDASNEIIYCFASIVASGGLSYVPTSETMAYRKYHIKDNKFDYDVVKCKLNGNDFNITNVINAYNQISGSQVAVSGSDLNGSGKIIKASDGYYYWGIGLGVKNFGGLILKSSDLESWSVVTYYPITLAQIDRNWTWEISLEEISQGVLVAAARSEGIGVTIAKYTISSGIWGTITSTPLMATRPFIFKDNGEFYLIGNISGSVTTPDYGTVARATTGIYKINSDLTLTQQDTVVVAEGCHYAEAVRVNDKIYLLYTTDSKRLDSTYAETNIGIKDITDIFE